jgi:hypothetical protein
LTGRLHVNLHIPPIPDLADIAGHLQHGALTQQKLNWTPTRPGLIADLDDMDYTQG